MGQCLMYLGTSECVHFKNSFMCKDFFANRIGLVDAMLGKIWTIDCSLKLLKHVSIVPLSHHDTVHVHFDMVVLGLFALETFGLPLYTEHPAFSRNKCACTHPSLVVLIVDEKGPWNYRVYVVFLLVDVHCLVEFPLCIRLVKG